MIVLTAERSFTGGASFQAVRSLAARFPGQETLKIRVGDRELTLGPAWRVAQCTSLLVALSEFGSVEVVG